MLILNLLRKRGLTLVNKKPCPLEIGDAEAFSSWAKFVAYGERYDLRAADFDIKTVGNGFLLIRVSNES